MEWIQHIAVQDNLDSFMSFVLDHLKADQVTDTKLVMEVRLICEELMTNTIHYAYKEEVGMMKVGYAFDAHSRELTICIEDQGVPFDPRQKDDPDIDLSMMDRKIGGLGIFMVKKLSDSVDYHRIGQTNQLIVKKKMEVEED